MNDDNDASVIFKLVHTCVYRSERCFEGVRNNFENIESMPCSRTSKSYKFQMVVHRIRKQSQNTRNQN